MKKVVLYILFLITAFGFSQSVKVQVDTTNIRIGEQFLYKLTVSDTANVILPNLDNLKGLEIVDSLKIDTLKNSLIQKFILTGFDSGAFYIPQQQVFIRNRAYLTDSILINVATVPIDTTKVRMFDIKNIRKEPIVFDDYKHYILWGVIALALIVAIIWYLKSRKKEDIEPEVIITKTPLEQALDSLAELDKKLLWQNNEVKKFYSELTEIVRAYIERELQIPALEQTTDELISALSDFNDAETIDTNKGTIAKLRALLQEADLVKFAKSKPLASEIEEDRKDAEDVLQNLKSKTIQEVETEEENDGLE